ncbi:hypothetical protein C0J52_03079 [Blattella germanica]|nr:hypothetical protein C0J52_03079 [Blattella germanica]
MATRSRVSVVVLGDIGRSPRMQYHSLSFAKEGYDVDVIGYEGSQPIKELREHPNVRFRFLTPATTLYDRPPETFKTISVSESHKLFATLAKEYPMFGSNKDSAKTLFTEIKDGEVVWRDDRPGLLVSSTSWTEDEDFSTLLSALQEYEDVRCDENCKLPALVCVITGKGPMKEYYCQKIKERSWKHIQIVTPWLKPEDYPHLLASADLGVSLHTSSSGLDLPMKVVDILNELVKHNINSWKFDDATQLADQLQSWFRGFPHSESQQERSKRFKRELTEFQKLRWHENWMFHALPLFTVQ